MPHPVGSLYGRRADQNFSVIHPSLTNHHVAKPGVRLLDLLACFPVWCLSDQHALEYRNNAGGFPWSVDIFGYCTCIVSTASLTSRSVQPDILLGSRSLETLSVCLISWCILVRRAFPAHTSINGANELWTLLQWVGLSVLYTLFHIHTWNSRPHMIFSIKSCLLIFACEKSS